MKPIVVQKYGGSSLADVERIKKVAARVVATQRAGNHVVVIVSAMGSTTNELLAKARAISEAPSRREIDMLLATGEQCSMALLAIAVAELGQPSVSLTGLQAGILTNDRHSGARIIEVRPVRVQDELEADRVVIIAGFQGTSYRGELTTLGRGGSDTSAVAIAAALSASYCEICSDVAGVFTADPRVVSSAEMLEAISCDEMLELAAHGAKVLHASCIEVAKRTGIALYARATAQFGGGTRVDPVGLGADVDAVGVTGQKQLVRVRAKGERCVDKVLAASSAARVPPLYLDTDMASADLWFGLADVPDWSAVRKSIGDDLEVLEGVGAVSVVGDGIGLDSFKLERARAVCYDAKVDIVAMSTSPLRVSFFCSEDRVDDLVRALHVEFIERAQQPR